MSALLFANDQNGYLGPGITNSSGWVAMIRAHLSVTLYTGGVSFTTWKSIISLCQHITQSSHGEHRFNPNPGFDVAIFNSNMSIQSVWTEPHQQISDLNRISNDLQMYFVPGLQQRHCMWFLAIC